MFFLFIFFVCTSFRYTLFVLFVCYFFRCYLMPFLGFPFGFRHDHTTLIPREVQYKPCRAVPNRPHKSQAVWVWLEWGRVTNNFNYLGINLYQSGHICYLTWKSLHKAMLTTAHVLNRVSRLTLRGLYRHSR